MAGRARINEAWIDEPDRARFVDPIDAAPWRGWADLPNAILPRVTTAFVHGNPETSAIWTPLVDALAERGVDDVVLLSPPGFGAPVPDDWPATQVAYRDWLVDSLEKLGGGVDVVGHDWGAAHLFGVLAVRPDLVRSWAADCVGLVAPDYEWHDMAKVWQTPDAGEQAIDTMLSLAAPERVAMYESLGLDSRAARDLAAALDETMGRCVLSLYRSAEQPAFAELGRAMESVALPPGLGVVPTGDTYAGSVDSIRERAVAFGATELTLDGLGHWWMFEAADVVADALVDHWDR